MMGFMHSKNQIVLSSLIPCVAEMVQILKMQGFYLLHYSIGKTGLTACLGVTKVSDNTSSTVCLRKAAKGLPK